MPMSAGSIAVLVGTTKGAFVVSGGAGRNDWTVEGPLCDGWPINHFVGDPATGRFGRAAAASGMVGGSGARPMAARTGASSG